MRAVIELAMGRAVFIAGLLGVVVGGTGGAAAQVPWSYEDLDRVLERYVTADGRVDYEGLAGDRESLDRYVRALAETSPDSDPRAFPAEADRLAYWINAYNALVLERVADAWPVDSVRSIRPLYGVFWMERHEIGGERLTLRGLENKIIRERFRDPRIHFAINCASEGCPPLLRGAWRPENLDSDLEQAARRFINDPRNVRIDPAGDRVALSRIFKWFADDFTGWLDERGIAHPRGVLDYVVRYLPKGESRRLREMPRVEFMEYDWSINARQD